MCQTHEAQLGCNPLVVAALAFGRTTSISTAGVNVDGLTERDP